ncbi:MAG: TonB-dependent receptor [Sphingobium sp.]|nr:TonB-dependent receptor [Sphingobium sp.]
MIKKIIFTVTMATASTAYANADTADQQRTANGDPESGIHAQSGIADIIVTATRRAENIQKAALSIQSLDSAALTRAGVTRPEDLASIAAGVNIGTGGNNPQTYIRGVGNYATDAYAEGAVAYNIDGAYISRPWATRGLFFDVDRVEVLKGPQGTLYGRNASGGAINILSKRPQLDQTTGFVELEAGNFDLFRASAAVNLPISSTLALRAAGQILQRDGYLSDGSEDEKSQSARLSLLWEPAPNFSALVIGSYQHVYGKGAGAVVFPLREKNKWTGAADPKATAIFTSEPGIGSLITHPETDGFLNIDVYGISAELNYDFGPAQLTILPAYREAKMSDQTYVPGFRVNDRPHDKQTSVEARLGGSSNALKWVLGGYYFNEDQTNQNGERLLFVEQGVNTQIVGNFDSNIRSYAGFGQATLSITDGIRLTGGLRYTYERKAQSGLSSTYSFPNETGGCALGNFDPTTPTPPLFCRVDIPLTGHLVYKNWTYKVGAEADIGPQSMAYINYSTGFKSGGFFAAPQPNTFRPEKLRALEVGVKNRFFDNMLQLNIEGFYWKYKDHQEAHLGPTSLPGFFTFITENAGAAKSYGADLDIIFAPTSNDNLSFKVQYNKTKYDSFLYTNNSAILGAPVTGCNVGALTTDGTQSIDCSGFQLVRSPTWSGTARYSHIFDLNNGDTLELAGNVQFSSGYYLSIDFLKDGYQDSYALGDLDVTYTTAGGKLAMTAYVHNVTKEAIATQGFRSPFISSANPVLDGSPLFLSSLRAPRTFGARIRYSF